MVWSARQTEAHATYLRKRWGGDPWARTLDNAMRKITQRDDGHWIWNGFYSTQNGHRRPAMCIYGLSGRRGAHSVPRFLYANLHHPRMLLKGRWLVALCSEKRCVNPEHFELRNKVVRGIRGTVDDRSEHARNAEIVRLHLLSEQAYRTWKENRQIGLARRFGISRQRIQQIIAAGAAPQEERG